MDIKLEFLEDGEEKDLEEELIKLKKQKETTEKKISRRNGDKIRQESNWEKIASWRPGSSSREKRSELGMKDINDLWFEICSKQIVQKRIMAMGIVDMSDSSSNSDSSV